MSTPRRATTTAGPQADLILADRYPRRPPRARRAGETAQARDRRDRAGRGGARPWPAPPSCATANAASGRGWTIEAVPMYNLKRGPADGKRLPREGPRQRLRPHLRRQALLLRRATPRTFRRCARCANIEVAFVPMNLPYTMPPEEAAEAVRAFHPARGLPVPLPRSGPGGLQQGAGRVGDRGENPELVRALGRPLLARSLSWRI